MSETIDLLPKPLFSVGDTAFYAGTTESRESYDCPDCNATGKWKAVSPNGLEVEITCPRCSGNKALSLRSYAPYAVERTVGQVRVEWPRSQFSSGGPISYMCVETGVGGGQIYDEALLFDTEETALTCAKLLAADLNKKLDENQPERAKYREQFTWQIERALKGDEADKRFEAECAYERLLQRICEFSLYGLAPELDESGKRTGGYLSCESLTDKQIACIQNELVWLDENAARYLMQHRAEAVA